MSLGVGMLYHLVSKKMKNWNCDKIKATDQWLWLSWVPYNIVTSDRDGSSHISLQGTHFRNFLTRKENYPKPVMDFPFFFSAEDVMSSLRKPCNFRSSQKKSTQKQEEWVGEELGQIDPGRCWWVSRETIRGSARTARAFRASMQGFSPPALEVPFPASPGSPYIGTSKWRHFLSHTGDLPGQVAFPPVNLSQQQAQKSCLCLQGALTSIDWITALWGESILATSSQGILISN